eukprot:jgi/Mesvir1/16804/Mv15169-RA.1
MPWTDSTSGLDGGRADVRRHYQVSNYTALGPQNDIANVLRVPARTGSGLHAATPTKSSQGGALAVNQKCAMDMQESRGFLTHAACNGYAVICLCKTTPCARTSYETENLRPFELKVAIRNVTACCSFPHDSRISYVRDVRAYSYRRCANRVLVTQADSRKTYRLAAVIRRHCVASIPVHISMSVRLSPFSRASQTPESGKWTVALQGRLQYGCQLSCMAARCAPGSAPGPAGACTSCLPGAAVNPDRLGETGRSLGERAVTKAGRTAHIATWRCLKKLIYARRMSNANFAKQVDALAFSFNGGKDSTVLLHLLRAAIAGYKGPVDRAPATRESLDVRAATANANSAVEGQAEAQEGGAKDNCGLYAVYFETELVHEELQRFTLETARDYGLNLEVKHESFKAGMQQLVERRGIRAILLGTREGDPNAVGQEVFSPSSEGWPPFMRINPILTWSYRDVWDFLRGCELPYCSLYDQGYTSIGNVTDTVPNVALQVVHPHGHLGAPKFLPAYMLKDGRLERKGRGKGIASRMRRVSGSCSYLVSEGSIAYLSEDVSDLTTQEGQGEGGANEPVVAAGSRNGDRGCEPCRAGAAAALAPKEHHHGGPEEDAALRSAGILVVGDEILTGRVADANTPFLLRGLRERGWSVSAVMMVPDDVDAIAMHVRRLSSECDLVICTGGIGPTHDDVTLMGIAKGFGVGLSRNDDMVAVLRSYYGDKCTEAHLKMADLPISVSDLIPTGGPFPLLRCKNVFVMPGVPSLLQAKWHQLCTSGELPQLPRFYSEELQLRGAEVDIMPMLNALCAEFGDIDIGSYPIDTTLRTNPKAPSSPWGRASGWESTWASLEGNHPVDGATLRVSFTSKVQRRVRECADAMEKRLPNTIELLARRTVIT